MTIVRPYHIISVIMVLIAVYGCSGCGKGSGNSSGSSNPIGNGNAGGSATLIWDGVSIKTDGTPLINLAGYKIYYGKSSGFYTEVITKAIDDALCKKVDDNGDGNPDRTECRYRINNLSPGTYFFAVTAYDSAGNESDFSNERSKVVN